MMPGHEGEASGEREALRHSVPGATGGLRKPERRRRRADTRARRGVHVGWEYSSGWSYKNSRKRFLGEVLCCFSCHHAYKNTWFGLFLCLLEVDREKPSRARKKKNYPSRARKHRFYRFHPLSATGSNCARKHRVLFLCFGSFNAQRHHFFSVCFVIFWEFRRVATEACLAVVTVSAGDTRYGTGAP